MGDPIRFALGVLGGASVGLAGTGCSVIPGQGFGAGTGFGAFDGYVVAYLVECRGCTVFYTGGEEVVQIDGLWTETVQVSADGLDVVTLTANPTSEFAFVRRAYIEVDGRVVASERRDEADVVAGVSLTARLERPGPELPRS
jgi:hypothetical protein